MPVARGLAGAGNTLSGLMSRARFWQRWAGTAMHERQIKIVNRLLEGFEGKLTSSKWVAIAKCSADTVLRDINELMAAGALKKSESDGRSTRYELILPILAL